MKKKRVRAIAIAAILLMLVGSTLWRLQIEPAGPSNDSGASQIRDTFLAEGEEEGQDIAGEENDDSGAAEDLGESEEKETQTEPAEEGRTAAVEEDDVPRAAEDMDEYDKNETQAEPVDADSGTGNEPPENRQGTDPPEEQQEEKKVLRCTFEIRCDTLANNPDNLDNEGIRNYIPANGVILATSEMEFTEGETVFDALKRITRGKDIQMEFRTDNLYTGGAYIEGINYLYEFDGGPLSGWMYKVNGQFPNYGCAGYTLQDGDAVVWAYTCDLGTDLYDNSHW